MLKPMSRKLNLEDIVAKLLSNASIQEGKAARLESEKSKSITLKVGEAFKRVQARESHDDLDETTALISKALRMTKVDTQRYSTGVKEKGERTQCT